VTGYTAYSYLTAGEDFRSFELAPEFGRVPRYAGGLTAEQEQRAQRLLRDSLVISLHDHPVRFPLRMEETPEYNRTGRQHAAYAGLAASGMTVVFDNMMDGTACVTGNAPWRWDDVITDLGMRQADLAHQDRVLAVRTLADIDEAYRSGRVGLVFGLESATPIENEIDRLDVLYGLGLRQIGIAYSDGNALGAGLAERGDAGLTAFGRRAVTRMNKLGLAIDLSHAGDRTALDTCEHSERPVFITHAGARAVWDTPRMKPDDVLRAVAGTGGVIGMSAAPHTTLSAAHPRHSIESVMDHFRYCADLVGIGHVAFGPDTLYGDHVALHRIFARLLSIGTAGGPSFEPVGYVDGLENPTENFANICGWLVKHGFGDADIRAVLGGNIYRALRSVWVRLPLPRRASRRPGPVRRAGGRVRSGGPAAGTGTGAGPAATRPGPGGRCPARADGTAGAGHMDRGAGMADDGSRRQAGGLMKTRAAVLREVGKDFEITELDLDPPKDGEVLVRFAAAGLCHSDDHLRTGDIPVRYPIVGGHEGAGVVEQAGGGVTRLRPGDHVVCSFLPVCGHCRFCARGMTNLCDLGALLIDNCLPDGTFRFHGGGEDFGQMCLLGTFSERAVVSEHSCVKIDDDLPLQAAALVGCGVPTGFGTAVHAGGVRPGDTTVIYGTGGVGINAVQGAAIGGARNVIAVDPVPAKLEAAARLGATHTAADAAAAQHIITEVTRGVGADQALVTVGVVTEEVIAAAFAAIRKRGTVVVTGLAGPGRKTIQLPGFELTLFEKRITGALFGGGNPFEEIPRLLELYRAGRLRLDELITTRYRLEDVNQGYRDMLDGRNIRGLIVYEQ
jgi:membrane dipeptidase